MFELIKLCEFSDGRRVCREKALYSFKGKTYCNEHYERFRCFEIGKPYIPNEKQLNSRDIIMINYEGIGI